jgi:hypothetical protein
VTLVTILAGWYEVRIGMVGEYMGSFLIWESILAVGNHIFGDTLHIVHTA